MKKNQLISQVDLGINVLPQDYSETEFLIGRSVDCHIILDDKKVSREHAKIIHSHGRWTLEKTSSDNLVKVNGDIFNKHILSLHDVISIDQFIVEVVDVKDEPTRVVERNEIEVEVEVEVEAKKSDESFVDDFTAIDSDSLKSSVEENNVAESTAVEELDNDLTGELLPLDDGPNDDLVSTSENNDYSNDDFLEDEYSTSENETTAEENVEQEYYEDNNSEENFDEYGENLPAEMDDGTKVLNSFVSVHFDIFGDGAPYDKFTLDQNEVFIGRDPEKCQIVLQDGEVSSVHAVVRRSLINVVLEDLNSSNGTLHNGSRVNKVELKHNDEFVIGSVAFTVKFRSEFLKDESSTLMPVDEHQTVEVEEIVEIHEEYDGDSEEVGGDEAAQEKSLIKRIWKDEAKRKKLIYGGVVLALLYFVFDEDKPTTPKAPVKKANVEKKIESNSKVKLTDAQREEFSNLYEVGKTHYENGRYREALSSLEKIAAVDPDFRENLQTLIILSKDGLKKLEELERERIAKIQAQEKKIKVEKLLEEAREYTKDRRVELANSVFDEIVRIDPDNIEVARLKMELDNWVEEKRRIALEEAQKKKDREDKVSKLQPAKALYLQKEWFLAIGKIQEFLDIKNMDEDLIKEATEMLRISKEELDMAVAPLIGKAKSLKEGQDLKGAYNVYAQILKIDPSNNESMQEMEIIKETLTNKAKKIYRDAIISESLSLFQDAKERFQEVQQISPADSEYYIKATDKLKYYLD